MAAKVVNTANKSFNGFAFKGARIDSRLYGLKILTPKGKTSKSRQVIGYYSILKWSVAAFESKNPCLSVNVIRVF